jgi:hypothetical protein
MIKTIQRFPFFGVFVAGSQESMLGPVNAMRNGGTTMSRSFTILIAVCLAAGAMAAQPTYHVGPPNNQVVSVGTAFNCPTTLYDPEVYLSNGKLILWGQGGSPTSCTKGMDSLYTATYNPPVNNWKVPLATDCPTLIGQTHCDHIPMVNPDPSGPLGSPSAVQVHGKVYMAYVAGNADYERGKLNWGVATGTSLSIYPSAANPIPIITPMQSGKTDCDKHGLGQVRLAYENGYFYFILFYYHFRDTPPADTPRSTLAYRINYDPANAWGLGSIRQIFTDGQWVNHDGNLVWNYDSPGGLPVFGNYDTSGLHFQGEGDMKWDPARLRWIHIFSSDDGTRVLWQETTSLASGSWSAPVDVDVSKVRAKYPSTPFVGAGIWYGDITGDNINNPRWWVFLPIHGGAACRDQAGNPVVFAGLSVAMATLDYY